MPLPLGDHRDHPFRHVLRVGGGEVSVWRCLVWLTDGEIVVTEFHATAATANERAAHYRSQGHMALVTEGQRSADGTFTPS